MTSASVAFSTRVKILTIGHDPDVEWPESGYDGWKPVSFNRRHSNFDHPWHYDLSRREFIWLRRKIQVGLAFWLSYYEHSLCRWSLRGEGPRCRWDCVDVAGILIWTGKPSGIGAKTHEDRASDARRFLEAYTDWCNGSCYWFSLEDAQGEPLDSCGGFIGTDHLAEAINESLEDGDRIIVKGEAADLAHYLPLKAVILDTSARRSS